MNFEGIKEKIGGYFQDLCSYIKHSMPYSLSSTQLIYSVLTGVAKTVNDNVVLASVIAETFIVFYYSSIDWGVRYFIQ